MTKGFDFAFPEYLTGYSIGDWMFNRQLLTENLETSILVGSQWRPHFDYRNHVGNPTFLIQCCLSDSGQANNRYIPKQFCPAIAGGDPRFRKRKKFASANRSIFGTRSTDWRNIVPRQSKLFLRRGSLWICGRRLAGALLYTKEQRLFNLSAALSIWKTSTTFALRKVPV